MRVILRNNQDPDDGRVYWSLTVGREYEVVSISADHYRIVDDTGDPYIFEPACFEVVDDNEPAFWKVSFGEFIRAIWRSTRWLRCWSSVRWGGPPRAGYAAAVDYCDFV